MIEEVRKWIQKEKLIQDGDDVIAGVSGGADSVCLLLVLLALQKEQGFSLRVVHVEHGIRGEESLADARYVEQFCKEKGVPCRSYHVDVPGFASEKGIGLEEAARLLRYDCYYKEVTRPLTEPPALENRQKAPERKEAADTIRKCPADFTKTKIALAHHADDNAETVLFQMIRGSGIRGLCGIRPKRDFAEGAEIIRPLLNVTRTEIEDYLDAQGQGYRTDSSNLSTDYSRNRIRHEVMPELLEINSQAVSHIAKSAERLQEIADYLDSQVRELLPAVCRKEEKGWLLKEELFQQYPAILQREAVLAMLGVVAGSRKDIGNVHVESVLNLASLQVGRKISLPYGVSAQRVYEGIRLTGESVKSDFSAETYEITKEMLARTEAGEKTVIHLPDGQISLKVLNFQGKIEEIPKKKYTKWLDYDKMKSGLQIRKRAAGDYLVIDGMGHRKKLKEYFIQEKIPADERGNIWLAADDSHVIWVIGGRISADYKIQKNKGKILEIQITGGNYYED